MSKVNKLDIISIGDAQLDTFIEIDQASVLCFQKKDLCWLCLSYADKIPITNVHNAVAGNAANVAIGSSRFGLKSAFYTVIGQDEIGDKIIEQLKKEKVDLSYVEIDKSRPTNYSVVINYQGERTQLVYNELRKYKLPKLSPAKWVYLTAMGKGSRSIHKDLIKYLKTSNAKLAYNPGPHEFKDRKHMTDILEMTDVLFVNKEEARFILEDTNHLTIKELLRGVRHLGPNVAIITDGKEGAYLFDGKMYLYVPAVSGIKVVEKTGAGDSFATGVISAIALGKSFEEALCWGSFNSASVIQYIGPQEGLLTLSKLRKFRQTHKTVCAKEF